MLSYKLIMYITQKRVTAFACLPNSNLGKSEFFGRVKMQMILDFFASMKKVNLRQTLFSDF
jgi:hypothetical protein